MDGTPTGPRARSSGLMRRCHERPAVYEDCSFEHLQQYFRMTVLSGGHLIIEALLLQHPARQMDGDVGGNLDRLRQDPHDPAIYLLLLRGWQFQVSGDG